MDGEEQTIKIYGETYVGTFTMTNGKPQGKGTITNERRDNMYTGQFEGGKPHGVGKMEDERGDIYEGKWKNEKKNCTGKHISVHGDIYEGGWLDGRKHGQGTMMWESTGSVYQSMATAK